MLSGESPETMDKREAARLLGCSVRHLERLLVDGDLEGVPNGPRGGLRPTRRAVEHRRAQTAPRLAPEDADTEQPAPPPPPRLDVPSGPELELSSITPAPPTPRRRTPRAGERKAYAAVEALAVGCCRRIRRHARRIVRRIVAASLVAGLLLIGASRDNTAPPAQAGRNTLVVIRHGVRDRHAVRVRCRINPGRALYIRIRSERGVRCSTGRSHR
jgi:hypothetical protein